MSDTGVRAIVAAVWRQPRVSVSSCYNDVRDPVTDLKRLLLTANNLNKKVKTLLLAFNAAVVKREDKELSPAGN